MSTSVGSAATPRVPRESDVPGQGDPRLRRDPRAGGGRLLSPSGARRGRRGVSMVEAAIVLPLVALLLMGLIEYGWLFLTIQNVHSAARHGARIGITDGATTAMVTAGVDTVMASKGLGASGYTVGVAPGDPLGLDVGDILTVTVSVAYDGNLDIVGLPLLPIPATIEGAVSMTVDGPQ